MSSGWYVARRLAFAVVAVYLVVSVAFAFVALTPDPNAQNVMYAAALAGEDAEEATSAYLAATGRDRPVVDRYVDWMVAVTTFDWGYSRTTTREPVVDSILSRLPVTLSYVVPAMVFALLGGVLVSLLSTAYDHPYLERAASFTSYLGLSLPNFFLAQLLVFYLVSDLRWVALDYDLAASPFAASNLQLVALPCLVVWSHLLAGQVRYARAELSEYVATDFVKVIRAKGASKHRIARHIVRNASAPLLTLFFTELLAVLLFSVFVVEIIFKIPGVGLLTFEAIQDRDMPLIVGTTIVPVVLGIVANLLQDVAYTVLDPRLEFE